MLKRVIKNMPTTQICQKHKNLIIKLSITVAFFLISGQASQTVDCIWHPQNLSVTSAQPINPLHNCLQYCQAYYMRTPQQAYYNIKTQMCEPQRLCQNSSHYYNLETNLCYQNDSSISETASYFPSSLTDETTDAHPSHNMICVNGYQHLSKINGITICKCQILWESSEAVDLNGARFYCDKVTSTPQRHFYNQLTFDSSGNVLSYGPYLATEMQIILRNLRAKELNQTYSQTMKSYHSILYAISHTLAQEELLREEERDWAAALLLILATLFAVSYCQFESLKAYGTVEDLRQRILLVRSSEKEQ